MLKRAVMVLGMALAGPALATDGLDPLASFLETNGVLVDRVLAFQGATEGFLKALDPGARFCSAEEAAALRADGMGMSGAATGTVAAVSLLPTLDSVELWPEDIAYLKVRGLRQGSGTELLAHLKGLAGAFRVIVDLRGADGFDLGSVVELASPCHDPGETLFTLQDTRGVTVATLSAGEQEPLKTVILVLTDRDTRGAAETLAALWRGCPGIMLIGTATRGDSRVRDILTVPDGRLLVMFSRRVVPVTAADYEHKGVAPDVTVTAMEGGAAAGEDVKLSAKPLSEKSTRDRELMLRVVGDDVLRRATDILLGLRAMNGYGYR